MKFGVLGTKAVATGAGLGPLSIEAGATARRGKLMYFSVSCSDGPLDHTVTIQIQRQTVTGTGTGLTAAVIDFGDLPANVNASSKGALTVSPTITANTLLFKRSFNTKYGFDFYPPPDNEIVYPATAASGIVWDTPIAAVTGDNILVFAQVYEQ